MKRKDTIFTNDLYRFPEIIVNNLPTTNDSYTLALTKYSATMPDADIELLNKILQATGMQSNQRTCIDISKAPTSFNCLQQNYKPHYIIGFGINPADVGLQFQLPPYHPITLLGIQFLFADALSVIANDKQKKAILWNCLKAMYKV